MNKATNPFLLLLAATMLGGCPDVGTTPTDTTGSDDDDNTDSDDPSTTITATSPSTTATTMTATDPTTDTTGDPPDDTTGDPPDDTTGDPPDDTTGDPPDETTTGGPDATTTGGVGDCVEITPGALIAANAQVYRFTGEMLGDADDDIAQFEFYTGDTGMFDLASAGVNDNYQTCNQCVRAFEDINEATLVQYFQSEGDITVSADSDPLNGRISVDVSGVTLVEVTIAADFLSTPVPDGGCVTLTDGTYTNVAPPPEWACPEASFGDGSCDCGCGAFDTFDCADGDVGTCDECNLMGSCAEADADCGNISPTLNPFCLNAMCTDSSTDGDLDAADPTHDRADGPPGAGCTLDGGDQAYEVHTFTAAGGITNVNASTCDMADFDSVVAVYQAPGGGADPFDPDNACDNLFAFNDDSPACGGFTSEAITIGLEDGEFQVVVTSFADAEFGDYTLDLTCL